MIVTRSRRGPPGTRISRPTYGSFQRERVRHAARVALDGPVRANAAPAYAIEAPHVEREDALDERRVLAAQVRAARQNQLVGRFLTQNPAESITNSWRGESPLSCVMAKNGMPWNETFLMPGCASKIASNSRWPLSWARKPHRRAGEELPEV